jgi:hypothetical protein
VIDGLAIGEVTSARGALEPLAQLLTFEAFESGDTFRVVRRGRRARETFSAADLVAEGERPVVSVRRAQETELPAEIGIGFSDALADYRASSASSRRLVGGSRRSEEIDTGAVLGHAVATGIADTVLQDIWAGRETVTFALPQRMLALEPADVCTLDLGVGDGRTLLVTRIEDAGLRRIEARTIEPDILSPVPAQARAIVPATAPGLSAPEVLLLDLPLITGTEPGYAPRIAAFAQPWPGALALSIGTAAGGFVPRQTIERRATMGVLAEALAPGPVARWDEANAIVVTLYGSALAGEPEVGVLNGANVAAVGTSATGYEVIQFAGAALVAPDTWRLSGLLRGQAGTADVAAAGHAAGANFVLLDRAVVPLVLSEAESGLALTLRCGAAGAVYDPAVFTDIGLTPARRGLSPLAPVHLSAVRDAGSGDIAIRWIRQTRIGGDSWDTVEVPLAEASEAYSVAIRDGSTILRTFAAATPEVIYAAADQMADFGTLPTEISIAVSQVSATEGPGLTASTAVNVGP